MNVPGQIAKHLREAYFGENWTAVDLKDTLSDVTWNEAVKKVQTSYTIAALVFHINYYLSPVSKVLNGEALTSSDKFSFDVGSINSDEEWQQLINKVFADADALAQQIEKLPDEKLLEDFSDPKYGNYYRNLHGIIEHTYYHLGQILLLKKIIRTTKNGEKR